jgi:glycosyltransferase involved in cell wall biosynthesis
MMGPGGQSLISIILIFFNEERFIEAAIESVFAQTYARWELLLVDDGSSDRSSDIARRYAQGFPEKVHYLEHANHQNRGMSASRNLGLRNASGQYVAFLDADDVWFPGKLEQQQALLDTHPRAAFVSGMVQWWYSWTGAPEDRERDVVQQLLLQLDTLVEPPMLLLLFLQDEHASLCDVMVRREIVERVGGYEDAFRGMYEDQVFHAKLCLAYPAFISSSCWYRYRQHPASCYSVAERTGQHAAARRSFLTWLEAYVSRQAAPDRRVGWVVQHELWSLRHPRLFRILAGSRDRADRLRGVALRIARRTLPARVREWLGARRIAKTGF